MQISPQEMAIHALSRDELERLARYAEATAQKMNAVQKLGGCPTGEALVQSALLKILNAERAIQEGHAAVINSRLQIRPELRSNEKIARTYEGGLRRWDPRKHDLIGFIKLTILSDLRAFFIGSGALSSSDVDLDQILDEHTLSPEQSVGRQIEIERFIASIDSAELRGVAECILFYGYAITDIMVEFGLTRSQADKRVTKILDFAKAFRSPH